MPSILDALQVPAGLLDVLLYLAKKDAASPKKAIEDLGMRRGTFYACIEKLRALDLLFERKEPAYPPRAFYGLNGRGRQAAEVVRALVPLVEGSAPSLERELAALRAAKPTKRNLARLRKLLAERIEQTYARGEWGDTLSLADELRGIASDAGEKEGNALGELWTGKVLQKRNDEACLAHLDAASRFARRAGDLTVAAEAAYLRGSYVERKGRYDEAEREFRRGGELAAKARSDVNRGRAALGLGRVLVARGRPAEARGSLEDARRWLATDEYAEEVPAVYGTLGASFFAEDVGEALAWHERAIRACELGGHVRLLAYELINAAGCLQKLGEAREARRRMDRARDLAGNLEDAKLIASVLIQSASLRSAQGDLRGAEGDARQAIEAATAEGLLRELAHATYLLGDILGERNQRAAARDALERALRLFRKAGDDVMARRLAAELRNLRT